MWHDRGRALLLTRGAHDWLANPADMRIEEKAALDYIPNEEFSGPLFLRDLRRVYLLEPAVGDPVPTVYRLVSR